MKKVLLVIESESFGNRVQAELQRDHDVLLCHDAFTAAKLMEQEPDALVLEMELPGMDGLTFLERLSRRPAVILVMGTYFSPYASQKLYDLNVGYPIRTPCTLAAVTDRLRDMLQDRGVPSHDAQQKAKTHLAILGIQSEEHGGQQLRVGIPLYAQDRNQQLGKELYPAIAEICGTTVTAVEHSMRSTIKKAWNDRDEVCWNQYFPKSKKCPSNKAFLSALAEKII